MTVLRGPERRRRWTSAEKARIVEESLAPGASVADVARRHDIHPNLLHVWRRQVRLANAAPARRERDVLPGGVEFAAVALAPAERILPAPPGTIEIEFVSELVRMVLGGPRYEFASCHLRDLEARTILAGAPWEACNPGSVRIAA